MEHLEKVKRLLSFVPPEWDEARHILSSFNFNKEDLAAIAISVVDDCFCEYREAIDPEIEEVTIKSMHSNYLIDSLRLLLDFDLDPNVMINRDNAMWGVQYVDAPNIGAASLRLLLEHGGNPNLPVFDRTATLFDDVDFKVSFDMYTRDYLHIVQCLWVLLAFGGRCSNGLLPITMLDDNKIEILKDFESFDYTIEPLPGKNNWKMHIYRKDTQEEVAFYK